MNEFLISTNRIKSSDTKVKAWASNEGIEFPELNVLFSWVPADSYTPHSYRGGILFAAVGIIYFRGKRIDRMWGDVLQLFNKDLTALARELDGYGNLFIYSPEEREGYIITSRMGFYALFYGEDLGSDHYAMGTNPDFVADCLEKNELDKESIAEFIATSCITAPHTYYQNIKQLEPASVYKIERNKVSMLERYWAPELDHEDFLSEDESIEKIAGFIQESVRKRIQENNGKGLLFLSGGLDSRSVLFSPVDPGESVEAATFYNEPNMELDLASSLAKIAGVKHHHIKRDFDYYADLAIDTIKDTGGMWNVGCFHMSGVSDRLRSMNPGIILSGMYFDTFFKGFAFDKSISFNKWTGRTFKEYPEQNFYWDARGSKDLKDEWRLRVDQRRLDYYGYDVVCKKDFTPMMLNRIKYSRICNMARIRSGGMDTALYKAQHYEMVVSDKNFSTVFSFLNPEHEIKSDFMARVLERLTEQKLPVDANIAYSEYLFQNYYFTVARGVLRRRVIRKLFPPKEKSEISVDSSWIDWYTYRKKSEKIRSLWKECDDSAGNIVTELMGFNPYKLEPDFSKSKYDFINLLTIGLWLKYGYQK